jgi:hypothetical protein
MLFSAVINPRSIPVVNMTDLHVRNQLFFDIRRSRVTMLERVYYWHCHQLDKNPVLLSYKDDQFCLLGTADRWIAHAAFENPLPVLIHSDSLLSKNLTQQSTVTLDQTTVEDMVEEHAHCLEPVDEATVSALVHGKNQQFRLSLVDAQDRGLARLGSGRDIVTVNYKGCPYTAINTVFDLAKRAWN